MQPLPDSPEIADGPLRSRPAEAGGAVAAPHSDVFRFPDFPTPRTAQARGVCFSGPARQAGFPRTDARRPQHHDTQEVQTCSKGNRSLKSTH